MNGAEILEWTRRGTGCAAPGARAPAGLAPPVRALALLGALCVPLAAAALDATGGGGDLEVRGRAEEDAYRREERPFAFSVDPSLPAPGTLSFGYTLGLGSGVSADRPIPVVLQGAGFSSQVSASYGLTSWLSPLAEATVTSTGSGAATSALVGVKLRLTSPDAPLRAAVMAGGLREGLSHAAGAWGRATVSYQGGSLLLEANGYLERVFAPGRDAVDYLVTAGASWQLLGALRAGAEYVGQDLEELGASGAEGGARQAAGPSLAVELDRGRYRLVAAVLFGVGTQSPGALARVGVVGSF